MSPPNLDRLPRSGLTYVPDAGRYRVNSTGRFLSESSARDIIDRDLAARELRYATIGEQLQSGEITLSEFRALMAIEVKALHLGEVAAGVGGFRQMKQADYGRAGQRIRYHYKALDGFVQDIQDNPELLTEDGAGSRMDFQRRLRMYAQAGRETYELSADAAAVAAGRNMVENILEPGAHHCKGKSSCVEQTSFGPMPARDPRRRVPGSRICGPPCKCKTRRFRAAASS